PKRKGHSRQLAAVPDAVSGNAAGSGASVGRISPVHPAKPAAPAASAPGPSRAHAVKKTAEDSKRKAVSRRDAEGVYEELESIPMKDEAAISASSDVPPAAAADMDEAARSEPKAKISAPKELPGFSLRLAFGKQSAEVLAGLKAMGAELESGPERAKSGGPAGDSYVLRLPASMIKDLAPYLERYGKAERDGILPAGQSPVRILLRIVPAPK
ncbi:MAG: hypothetical protein ABIW76_15045, partial [Fibrobacteria bacterium]